MSLHERTGADELMLTSAIHGREAQLRSYELIAREMNPRVRR
jgi:hypothetical protein